MRSSSLAYFSLVLSLGMGAWAQMAQCLTGWEWNQNSLGQDPCKVGSMLDAACRGEVTYNYATLNGSEYYVSPSKNHTGDMTCDCNTVMYSLIMACATCQDGIEYGWPTWANACDGVYIAQYPLDIPQGTAVPRWAFYNVTLLANGLYDNVNAQSIGRDPEALPKQLNTLATSVGPSSTGGPSPAGGPNPTGSVKGNSSSSGSNIGAIVGGVIGGVATLVIIVIIIFFIVRRGRKNRDDNRQSQYSYQQEASIHWKSPPTSPTYVPSISSGPTVVANVPFQPYNLGSPPTFPPPMAMGQARPISYVTPISNNGGGR